MSGKSLIMQEGDGPAQRAGSPCSEGGNSPENPIYQGALAGTDYTARDVSTQNDSATPHADTGNIRGICSPDVPEVYRPRPGALTPLQAAELVQRKPLSPEAIAGQQVLSAFMAEVDRRLAGALHDAGRSALGMPGTVDTFKAMLHRAGLVLVLS